MAMEHAFMTHDIKQLEELFAASTTDPEVLKLIENELRYRQVPHALALLVQVQGALNGARAAVPARA